MNGKTILDTCQSIIARTDTNRTLLLQYVNEGRRQALMDTEIRRFFQVISNISQINGLINGATNRIKHAKSLEYQDAGGTISHLHRLRDYEHAKHLYPSFTVTGTPLYYIEIGADIQVLPVPATGQINFYGEIWPVDLTDDVNSSDITTIELGMAWVSLGLAFYFVFLQEFDKSAGWKQDGDARVAKYLSFQIKEDGYKLKTYPKFHV